MFHNIKSCILFTCGNTKPHPRPANMSIDRIDHRNQKVYTCKCRQPLTTATTGNQTNHTKLYLFPFSLD